jgi:hypothetical protein
MRILLVSFLFVVRVDIAICSKARGQVKRKRIIEASQELEKTEAPPEPLTQARVSIARAIDEISSFVKDRSLMPPSGEIAFMIPEGDINMFKDIKSITDRAIIDYVAYRLFPVQGEGNTNLADRLRDLILFSRLLGRWVSDITGGLPDKSISHYDQAITLYRDRISNEAFYSVEGPITF